MTNNTITAGSWTVTIGGDSYTKTVSQYPRGLSADYFVHRVLSNGTTTTARLNPHVHRYAIAKIETAIKKQG